MFFKNEGHIPFVSYPEFRKNFTTEKCFGQSNGFKKDQTIIVLSENAWWMIAINECLKVQRKSLDKESGPFTIPSFERWKLRNSMSVSQECIDIIIHFCIYAYCKNDHGSRKRRDEISKNLPSCWQSLPSSSRFIFPHFLPILFFDVMCYIVSEALRTWPYMFKGFIQSNLLSKVS